MPMELSGRRHRAAAFGLGMLLLGLTVDGLRRPVVLAQRTTSAAATDAALFEVVTTRVRNGEPYYTAMGTELTSRGYPTGSLFNWRPPALFLFVAWVPEVARAILALLALAVLAGTVSFGRTVPLSLSVIMLAVQVGAVVPGLIPQGVYLPEAWAGLLIALSVLAYHRQMPVAGAVFAVLAAFARDLAAPYLIVCLLLTNDRRWLLAGGALLASYYGWHAAQVFALIPPDAQSHPSWLAFGGWPFIISTVQASGWFLIAPCAFAVLGAVLVVASVATTTSYLRWTVVAYLALFSMVGLPLNAYWGLLMAPTWGLAIPSGMLTCAAILRAVGRRPEQPPCPRRGV